ncbi:MAG: hypothetical protein V1701_02780 [Planctomycetota bacterium]
MIDIPVKFEGDDPVQTTIVLNSRKENVVILGDANDVAVAIEKQEVFKAVNGNSAYIAKGELDWYNFHRFIVKGFYTRAELDEKIKTLRRFYINPFNVLYYAQTNNLVEGRIHLAEEALRKEESDKLEKEKQAIKEKETLRKRVSLWERIKNWL